MSSRALRKLHGDIINKELLEEPSDTETDNPINGGVKKKQFNINRYDLLHQQSHSESEVKEDDNETEAPPSCNGDLEISKRKKKKKKKRSGKYNNTQRSSEDNADPLDEVERSVREVNRLLGETYKSEQPLSMPLIPNHTETSKLNEKNLLAIQHKYLNPNNEMKKMFGSKVVQSDHKKKMRGGSRAHMPKATWMTTCKDTWPQMKKTGLSMNFLESKRGLNYFTFEHSQSYRAIENKFLEAVESLNPSNIVSIINEHHYHVDALIQLSDICKLSEDLAMAADLIERALYCLELAFHPLFNLAHANNRLDYRRQENRALYITAFKHLLFVGERACPRTALEFCKLILSLDPEGDPLAIILAIDFYALRAKQYDFLKKFYEEWEPKKNLSLLPNFAYSIALAHFYSSNGNSDDTADKHLQYALETFPGVLLPLMEKCSIQPDPKVSSHLFFAADANENSCLSQFIKLYVTRNYHLWKDGNLLPWLQKNVDRILTEKNKNNSPNNQKTNLIWQSFKQMKFLPTNVVRHLVLSDLPGLTPVAEGQTTPIMSFDPLPPPDSINIYTRNKKPAVAATNSQSPVVVFFRSLLPSFNPDEPAGALNLLDDNMDAGENDANAAAAGNEGELRRSVTLLVNAMRFLLNSARPDHQNEADVDENYETDEDYLT